MCQRNGAASAAWAVVSITIVRAHKRKGHGAKFMCPISNLKFHLAGIIFVDDTDLIHINMGQNEDADLALIHLQDSILTGANYFYPHEALLNLANASTT